jgi:hypothetical protein
VPPFRGVLGLELLFTSVLRQCTDSDLVGGRRLLVDATHVEADAALKSLRAELAVIDGGGETDAAVALSRLAAATAINLKRLLAHGAHDTSDSRSAATRARNTSATAARLRIAARMLALLTATLDEISRLRAADTSTGS